MKNDELEIAMFGDIKLFKNNFNERMLNKKDDFGYSLLHNAISGEKYDIAMFLINKGIDVNIQDSDGFTALHYIASRQNTDVAKALFESGADINMKDKYGNNAMWTAIFNCKGRYYEMVELFSKYNPDLTSKNKAGKSPLDFAYTIGFDRLLEIIESGRNISD